MAGGRATRRELLRDAATIAVLGATVSLVEPRAADASQATEAAALQRVLAVEQVAVFAYAHVLSTGIVSVAAISVVSKFLAHERQHARRLSADLNARGGSEAQAPSRVSDVDAVLSTLHVSKRLGDLETEKDAIELLIGVEAALVGSYYVAISALEDPALLHSAAQTMADEAQHATMLRRLLHPRSIEQVVPNAFVDGGHQSGPW